MNEAFVKILCYYSVMKVTSIFDGGDASEISIEDWNEVRVVTLYDDTDCELTMTDFMDLKIVGIFMFTFDVLGTAVAKLIVRVYSVLILIYLLY
jgi:hypothetical protein